MEYRIEIKDMENLQDTLILEYAERSSITLNWIGGDDKTKPIVGSELNFSMEVLDGADGKYFQYFTSDEQKWQVTKYIAQTDTIVWRGYLLPESYSEPWQNPTFYPKFSAVDGLGLLKGKELTEDFYDKEKTVTEVLAACLKLTGIEFDIYFAPAIINHLEKQWHNIYIDGRKWFDEDKLPSAHDFLKGLVSSLKCQLFQSEGRWYIEGINKRHLPTVTFWKYDIDGVYLGQFDIDKNIKKVHWAPHPNITMVPALREVTVSHPAAKLSLNPDIFQERDIDWAQATGVVPNFLPRHWNYTEFQPKIYGPEYYLELYINSQTTLDTNRKIGLREKPYVLKGTKVRFKLETQLIRHPIYDLSQTQISQKIDDETWVDMLVYKLSLNGTQIFYNATTTEDSPQRLTYDNNLSAKVQLEFIAKENGYIDIELFQPIGEILNVRVEKVRIVNLELEDIEQKDDFIYTEMIDEKSSTTKEIELTFSDDYSGASKCFYPEKQQELDPDESFLVEIPIKYGKQQGGNNFAIVSLEGAVLMEQYPESVYHDNLFDPIDVLDIVYNRNNGEEMAVKTTSYYASGSFYVKTKPYKTPNIDRTEWLKWSDSNYQVEQKPYAQVVAEIYRKLFSAPHLMIEGTAYAPVKYNDLISFTFRNEDKFFIPTNVSWNSDENESNVTLIEGVYAGNSLGDIPPYVDAGPDINIGETEAEAQISEAVESAPNGYVVSRIWEQITGTGATYSSASALNPLIKTISEQVTEHRLTVTDNLGASASDSMKVIKVGDYTLSFSEQDTETVSTSHRSYEKRVFKIVLSPEVPPEENLVMNFKAEHQTAIAGQMDDARAEIAVHKNGAEIYHKIIKDGDDYTYPGVVNYNAGDEIIVTLEAEAIVDNTDQSSARAEVDFTINKVEFQETAGNVGNLPVTTELIAFKQ